MKNEIEQRRYDEPALRAERGELTLTPGHDAFRGAEARARTQVSLLSLIEELPAAVERDTFGHPEQRSSYVFYREGLWGVAYVLDPRGAVIARNAELLPERVREFVAERWGLPIEDVHVFGKEIDRATGLKLVHVPFDW